MNRKFRRAVVFCSMALFPALAAAKLSSPAEPLTTFRAVGPGGFRIEGRTSKMAIADDNANVTITIPLVDLTTGIALRDKHMREKYLETEKYPEAELKIARWALRFPEDGKRVSAWAPGTLKMHGKTKEVKVFYKATRAGAEYTVNGTTEVNVTDFGIENPSHLGLSLKPDVAIEVHFKVQDS